MGGSTTLPNTCWESFYSARFFSGFYGTFDVQRDSNPAYNHDRGPVMIYTIRLHLGLSLNPGSGPKHEMERHV